jgi:omega-6 fatty acid desaturase (delta-12 desaturase)
MAATDVKIDTDIDISQDNGSQCPVPIKTVIKHCKNYHGSETKRSALQITSTLGLFLITCGMMLYCLSISYWLVMALTIPAAGLLTRIFILQHDCGHGSFWTSKKANDWTGRFLGLLTFTPYDAWRRAHNKHHATSGSLDHRGIGSIDTITVREYKSLSKSQQFFYRIYRNPIVFIIVGSPVFIILAQRVPFMQQTVFFENYQTLPLSSIWKSIMTTNIGLVIFYGILGAMVGYGALAAIYLPILIVTSWIGTWLFFIQHQFEDTYWEKHNNWSMQEAALMGSSYYALPPIIQWFSGNIGIHHIHHLSCKIPNYKLQECMDALPELREINRMGFIESLKCANFKLWDEEQSKLVTFSAL